ncbi:hypothetical protein QBC34DRAFT_413600 [Podospora aff. communis PSN243]|uniref:DUF2828 domain-containing protein n=1 Tax=Podospora aff. communis PSN243 TaxID=3040156 RepID=A0AAV9G981_9PEZI|nr:hypothetical protein QBC34DRAFT_413600 [Podospora aff. communis PSN243]
MASEDKQEDEAWFLKAKCPVFLPKSDALTLSAKEFDNYLAEILKPVLEGPESTDDEAGEKDNSDSFTVVSAQSTTAQARELLQDLSVSKNDADEDMQDVAQKQEHAPTGHPFVDGLKSHEEDRESADMENKMLTENADIAFRSTKQPLLDLFYELEEVVSGPRLLELLPAAWACDALATVKIIFNARSIHLGKSSRLSFYRCAGWLAFYHPHTLVANLRWLSRPVIPKKVEKKDSTENEDMVVIEPVPNDDVPESYDVRNGVAHGYWKDLLNLLALSANDKLSVLANPKDVLNIERQGKEQTVSQEKASEKRRELRDSRHGAVLKALEDKPVHRALHLAIARLFADQLALDIGLLRGEDPKGRRNISLCAKWAPSTARFHDKHTFVTSSIAEILYPEDYFVEKGLLIPSKLDSDREVYLRHAREAYRKDISALRKHLEVVERDLTANDFEKIKYDRVPSIAMQNYSEIFAKKDTDRFEAYLDNVASGKSQISGATLLPSTLVHSVLKDPDSFYPVAEKGKKRPHNALVSARLEAMVSKVVDGQWNSLVQRIKGSGTMESCIAVCDVSGSMSGPIFSDGTCPMDSAIGLSLLIAEVTQPPFGGTFITFSETPTVETVDLSKTLSEKVSALQSSAWGMTTDFEAVFLRLILPMAVEKKLTQDQLVKRIFVFSDMQFNAATSRTGKWSTSYERIKEAFAEAGYTVPELIFWNLAGGRAGYNNSGWGDPVAPKPVTAEEEGVAMVSGYSQGMLKVFLDNGTFEEEEDVKMIDEVGEDDVVAVETSKKAKIDPMSVLNKAISHKAYSMLKVVD